MTLEKSSRQSFAGRNACSKNGQQKEGGNPGGPAHFEQRQSRILSAEAYDRYGCLGGWLAVMTIGLITGMMVHALAFSMFFPYLYTMQKFKDFLAILMMAFNSLTIVLEFVACVLILKGSRVFKTFYGIAAAFFLVSLILVVSIPNTLPSRHGFVAVNYFVQFLWIVYVHRSRRVDVYFQYYRLVKPPAQTGEAVPGSLPS